MLVDLEHLGVQVLGDTVRELGDRIDARGFQQVGILLGHAHDPDQVGMVDPPEDECSGNARLLGDLVASLGRRALLQELLHGLDVRVLKLLRVDLANALDVDDLLHGKLRQLSMSRPRGGDLVKPSRGPLVANVGNPSPFRTRADRSWQSLPLFVPTTRRADGASSTMV